MPSARLPTYSKTPGAERIGAALKRRWPEIDRHAIEKAKAKLDTAYNSVAQPIINAAAETLSDSERISHDEKRKLAVELRSRGGLPVLHINILCNQIWMDEQEERSRAIERQDKLAKYSLGRPLSNDARGKRLQEAVEKCRECVHTSRNSYDTPHAPIIRKLAAICLEQILSELRRLQILGICRYCGKTLFPAIATKLYCSPRYEGRDCSHRQASKTYDVKRRTHKS
jgi:hypothetical protein